MINVNNAMNSEQWATSEQVAQHLVVAKDSIYRWCERLGLPAHKTGRLWKFQISEVGDWMRARCEDEKSENNRAELEDRHT